MAKLYFRYSAMDAGKTLDLIKVAYNYNDRGQRTVIITSKIDKRAGENKVLSRVGLGQEAISTSLNDNIYEIIAAEQAKQPIACVLIDEINFFSVDQIQQISDAVDYLNVPIICYGLRSDYCGRPFPSSAQLLAIADTIEELKTICHCGRKAVFNMLIRNGVAIKEGDQVVVDDDTLKAADSRFMSVCRRHWKEGKWK